MHAGGMRTSVPVLLMSGVLLLSACGGSDDGPGDEPRPDASPSAPPGGEDDDSLSEPSPEPTLTAKPDGRAVSVGGVVRVVPEDRCTFLVPDDGSATWVLVGAIADLVDGERVTVAGRADTGTTSRCQSGPVLVVSSAQPAS